MGNGSGRIKRNRINKERRERLKRWHKKHEGKVAEGVGHVPHSQHGADSGLDSRHGCETWCCRSSRDHTDSERIEDTNAGHYQIACKDSKKKKACRPSKIKRIRMQQQTAREQ